MRSTTRLTDAAIRSALKITRHEEEHIYDGAVPGLSLRLSPAGSASWSHVLRVVGEGGTNRFGKRLLGKRRRVGLGSYPEMSLEAARAKASAYNEQARRGINPKLELEATATAGSFEIGERSQGRFDFGQSVQDQVIRLAEKTRAAKMVQSGTWSTLVTVIART